MAELSEVEQLLVSVIAAALYPRGTAAASVAGVPVKIYRGWPAPGGLDADLRVGSATVTVFPLDSETNSTRYLNDWYEVASPPLTLAPAVGGQTVTLAGTPCCPCNAALVVDGHAFVHPVQATDTPASIATALAVLVSGTTPATSSGNIITIPGAAKIAARAGAVGSIVQELKRQKKLFRVTAWCPDPATRDTLAATIDAALAAVTFLTLPDGTAGRLRYERSRTDDAPQKAALYRRDLEYSVEYATTTARRAAAVVAEQFSLTGGPDPAAPPVATFAV